MIDMCNALGIEPVITTTETDNAQEFADLVEYCHGDDTTPMGKKRVADGHPQKYDVKYFELGNEQYNPNYVEQVAAMEAKARTLGAKNAFLSHFFNMKTIILPRQARDKHRKR
jgi:alpha-N-arabinofuranosidase